MAVGTSLGQLLVMLKSHIGASLQAGTQMDTQFGQLLADAQQLLTAEFNFPYLEDRWDVSAPPGSRYLDFPTVDILGDTYDIDPTRPIKAEVFYNQRYQDLDYGISSEEYNYLNPDLLEVVDPIQRWRWLNYKQGAVLKRRLEVWPMNSTAQVLRFTGQRTMNPLQATTDRAELDDELLVLTVAVDILSKSKQGNAQIKLQGAQRRLQQLRSSLPEREGEQCVFGGGDTDYMSREARRLVPIVLVAKDK